VESHFVCKLFYNVFQVYTQMWNIYVINKPYLKNFLDSLSIWSSFFCGNNNLTKIDKNLCKSFSKNISWPLINRLLELVSCEYFFSKMVFLSRKYKMNNSREKFLVNEDIFWRKDSYDFWIRMVDMQQTIFKAVYPTSFCRSVLFMFQMKNKILKSYKDNKIKPISIESIYIERIFAWSIYLSILGKYSMKIFSIWRMN